MKRVNVPFAKLPIELLLDNEISSGAKLLYAYLDHRQGQNDTCWPTQTTAAEALGVVRETVNRYAQELEGSGWIEILYRKGLPCEYSVNREPVTEKSQGCDETITPTCDAEVTQNNNQVNYNQEQYAVPGQKTGPPGGWEALTGTKHPTELTTPGHHPSLEHSPMSDDSLDLDVIAAFVADKCRLDLDIEGMHGKVRKAVGPIVEAGYPLGTFRIWWEWYQSDPWRVKNHPVPSLWSIAEKIGIALQWKAEQRSEYHDPRFG